MLNLKVRSGIIKKNKNNNKYQKLSVLIIIITLIIVVSSVIVLIKSLNVITPDYATGVIDKNAVPLPKDDKKLSATEGGGAVSLSYSDKVAIDLSTKEVTLYFQNPSRSTHNIVLEIIITRNDKDIVIAKSNLIPVGNALYKLELSKDAKLTAGGYYGKFNIIYYDETTNERAALNTNIPIEIGVK